ncbi:MAG: YciI family protein [Acidobacteria bacterium]|nr:YciI family protein [Acidobacteriota bacterium]
MRYMLLIYDPESAWESMPEAERNELFGEYMAFTESIRESGHLLAGDPLEPTATATTIRVRGGKAVTSDGPFAETREQLGGYYIVEARDLDEALGLAARVPSARIGCVEVRPIVEMG